MTESPRTGRYAARGFVTVAALVHGLPTWDPSAASDGAMQRCFPQEQDNQHSWHVWPKSTDTHCAMCGVASPQQTNLRKIASISSPFGSMAAGLYSWWLLKDPMFLLYRGFQFLVGLEFGVWMRAHFHPRSCSFTPCAIVTVCKGG